MPKKVYEEENKLNVFNTPKQSKPNGGLALRLALICLTDLLMLSLISFLENYALNRFNLFMHLSIFSHLLMTGSQGRLQIFQLGRITSPVGSGSASRRPPRGACLKHLPCKIFGKLYLMSELLEVKKEAVTPLGALPEYLSFSLCLDGFTKHLPKGLYGICYMNNCCIEAFAKKYVIFNCPSALFPLHPRSQPVCADGGYLNA